MDIFWFQEGVSTLSLMTCLEKVDSSLMSESFASESFVIGISSSGVVAIFTKNEDIVYDDNKDVY